MKMFDMIEMCIYGLNGMDDAEKISGIKWRRQDNHLKHRLVASGMFRSMD